MTEYGSVALTHLDPRWQREFAINVGSIYLPEYILDLYLSAEPLETAGPNGEVNRIESWGNSSWASNLALCESPKAGEILEQWINEMRETPGPSLRAIERCLEIWQTRNTLRQMKMEVFQDLVAGRMSPDDLLLPQSPWVWKDGEYVQAE